MTSHGKQYSTSVRLPGVAPGMVEWLVPAPALEAWQDVAHHLVLPQVAVGWEQPGPPQFCHSDKDAQRADGDRVKAPQAGRAAGLPWFCPSRSRRW
jgi:hypothetical protein